MSTVFCIFLYSLSFRWDSNGPRRRPIPSSRLRRRFLLTAQGRERPEIVSSGRVLDCGW